MAASGGNFWYNTSTGQVEEGKQSTSNHLMGPYGTREEAARALEIAAQRNEEADQAEEAERRFEEGE